MQEHRERHRPLFNAMVARKLSKKEVEGSEKAKQALHDEIQGHIDRGTLDMSRVKPAQEVVDGAERRAASKRWLGLALGDGQAVPQQGTGLQLAHGDVHRAHDGKPSARSDNA